MKNVFHNYVMGLILLLLGLSANDGFSQSGPLTNLIKICSSEVGGTGGTNDDPSNCPDDALEVQLNEDCEGFVKVNVFATNIATGNLTIGQTYQLPFQYPPFYLKHEYSPGNWLYTGPYTTFYYEGVREGADGTDADIFYMEAELSTYISNVQGCTNAPTGEVVTFDMGVELLTLDRGYHPYPVDDYANNHQIFSCNFFDDTYCLCHPGDPECSDYEYEDPVFSIKICLDCIECLVDAPNDPYDPTIPRGINSGGNQYNHNLEMQLSPNPFGESVNLSFIAKTDSPLRLQIYDAQGRLMQEQNEMVRKGRHQQTVSTAELPAGIYYFHLQYGDTQISQKLIKIQ